MSDETGAGASALDVAVVVSDAELEAVAASERAVAEDAVARMQSKVEIQALHLENARIALAEAEAALAELES